MYELKPVTERIQKIRDMYRNTRPKISLSRYKLLTEYYQSHPQLNGILKRSGAYKYLCENLDIEIHDHEMIVGSHSPYYRGATFYPENDGKWIKEEVTSRLLMERDIDPYILDEEDRQYILDTIDFWAEGSTSETVTAYLAPDYEVHGGNMVITWGGGFPACSSPTGHFIVGHQKILDRGLQSIHDEAVDKMHQLAKEGIGDRVDQYNFYRGMAETLEGAMTLAQRYSDLAAEKAAKCEDPKRKEELELISKTMAWVPRYPARTFFEAAQCVFFYQMLVTFDAQLHGTSFGRIDQYLGPYYEKDLKDGLIDADQAQEIIDFLMLKIAEQNKPWSYGATRSGPGYTSGQLVTLGGVDSRGHDASNPVTYMILQGSARLVLHSPPLSLRVHKNTPDELWEAAIETTKRCGGVPTFESDEAIVPALRKRGLSFEDARNYGLVGCVEPAGNGTEWPQCGGSGTESYFMIPNALIEAINNGINPMRFPGAPEPHQTGLPTGYLYEMESFEEVKEAYRKQIEFFAQWHVDNVSTYQYVMRWNQPVLIASAGIEGCMESGRDVTNMGAKYTNVGIAAIGTGNVADSLAAIKYLVYDEKTRKFTPREFYDAWINNWEGELGEKVHTAIINEVPHFGNGDPYVDELGAWGIQVFADAFNGKKAYNGTFHAGAYPVTAHVMFGQMSFATPDGRYTGDSFSDGISGVQGRDTNGPTGVLASVSHLNSVDFSNGTLLNMKFSPSALANDSSKKKLAELMQTYLIDMKGMEMQLNVVSTKTMKDARVNPENYKDLVVRIAGFSAYFVEISEEAKDDLIARTEMEEV
ncbi:MAG: glycyl radical protein [Coriobacteriales bacterium]|jgi:pyruvate formate-lyase/glycerol dehydratase family glycyl radical enzyme